MEREDSREKKAIKEEKEDPVKKDAKDPVVNPVIEEIMDVVDLVVIVVPAVAILDALVLVDPLERAIEELFGL